MESPPEYLEGSPGEKERLGSVPQTSVGTADSPLKILELVKIHDQDHPIHWPTWKKWAIITVYCLLQTFVTITSTSYVSAEYLVQLKFGGSVQVVTLGQSMFIVGNAFGPVILGPLS